MNDSGRDRRGGLIFHTLTLLERRKLANLGKSYVIEVQIAVLFFKILKIQKQKVKLELEAYLLFKKLC